MTQGLVGTCKIYMLGVFVGSDSTFDEGPNRLKRAC